MGKAYFSGKFNSSTYFNYTTFKEPGNVTFGISHTPFDMSNVSFSDSDITRIRFSDNVTWGAPDKFTIIEEWWLIAELEERNKNKSTILYGGRVGLELILSVYRNLRENYEFRLRYDDAGKFFRKEMELKRKYREAPSPSAIIKYKLIKLFKKLKLVNINVSEPELKSKPKKNSWWRRQFSVTGLYYHFSTYGESIIKPVIIGVIIVGLSTLFWLTQSKPTLEPHFFINSSSSFYNSTSHFVYLSQAGNSTHWLTAFQRSLADFLPLLSLPSDIKVGAIDFIVKIVGGALTFVLLGVALRRKFERKYTS